MNFEQKLNETIEKIYHYNEIILSEDTQKRISGVIEELYMRKIIAELSTMSRINDEPITSGDIALVIKKQLEKEGFEGGDEEKIRNEVERQLSNPGVVESIYMELKKNRVPFIMPRA